MVHSAPSRIVSSGLAAAFVALAAFGLAHALIIAPIWTRLAGGIPFVLGAGLAFAWAFDVWCSTPPHADPSDPSDPHRHRRSESLASGVQFGAVMFFTLLPGAAFEAALRLNGLRTGDWAEAIAAVTLAMLAGAGSGWLLTLRRDAALAFAVAALALMFASAGPLPFAQSVRGAWLSVAIAPICLLAGAMLAVIRARFHLQGHRP
jgi:hypothetical protein